MAGIAGRQGREQGVAIQEQTARVSLRIERIAALALSRNVPWNQQIESVAASVFRFWIPWAGAVWLRRVEGVEETISGDSKRCSAGVPATELL